MTRLIGPETLDACVSFYALAGFTLLEPPPALAERGVWLQRGPTQLHLLTAPDAHPEQGHFALVEPRYEELVERLTAAGYAVEPRREHWGSPRAYVRDPAGNLVEIMQSAP